MQPMGSSSLTRDRTQTPCIGSAESLALDPWGSPKPWVLDNRGCAWLWVLVLAWSRGLGGICAAEVHCGYPQTHLSLRRPPFTLLPQVRPVLQALTWRYLFADGGPPLGILHSRSGVKNLPLPVPQREPQTPKSSGSCSQSGPAVFIVVLPQIHMSSSRSGASTSPLHTPPEPGPSAWVACVPAFLSLTSLPLHPSSECPVPPKPLSLSSLPQGLCAAVPPPLLVSSSTFLCSAPGQAP